MPAPPGHMRWGGLRSPNPSMGPSVFREEEVGVSEDRPSVAPLLEAVTVVGGCGLWCVQKSPCAASSFGNMWCVPKPPAAHSGGVGTAAPAVNVRLYPHTFDSPGQPQKQPQHGDMQSTLTQASRLGGSPASVQGDDIFESKRLGIALEQHLAGGGLVTPRRVPIHGMGPAMTPRMVATPQAVCDHELVPAAAVRNLCFASTRAGSGADPSPADRTGIHRCASFGGCSVESDGATQIWNPRMPEFEAATLPPWHGLLRGSNKERSPIHQQHSFRSFRGEDTDVDAAFSLQADDTARCFSRGGSSTAGSLTERTPSRVPALRLGAVLTPSMRCSPVLSASSRGAPASYRNSPTPGGDALKRESSADDVLRSLLGLSARRRCMLGPDAPSIRSPRAVALCRMPDAPALPSLDAHDRKASDADGSQSQLSSRPQLMASPRQRVSQSELEAVIRQMPLPTMDLDVGED
eukprot:gnl/TRDRNA2_/TRDRNA2_80514_c0_seq1.p1 gnl/TRDRNA2_/TRDRNA2_80514_c0~~gnl/TRDRNA2_/TRDRNA2_80514_c0_seq1.p1  ORF type:complete len:464 (-),score=45.25 gnl/TRDRNA2_/TRDRNA2_80514_c0_seq1:38-1429(-)